MTSDEKVTRGEIMEALEPFAGVVDWAERINEHDRDAHLNDVMVWVGSPATGAGYSIEAEAFYKAHALLSRLGIEERKG